MFKKVYVLSVVANDPNGVDEAWNVTANREHDVQRQLTAAAGLEEDANRLKQYDYLLYLTLYVS